MKTEAIEELIEHCKHIGGIPAVFLKERIIAAEEELKVIKAAQQSVQSDGALCADCGKSPAMEGCTVCAECGL